jgi:riboflavin kinase/FMN adenylyltransferase
VGVYSELAAVPRSARVVAIGTFDGVHVGHRAVIAAAVATAAVRHLTATVLTFDRHPLAFLDPDRRPHTLTPLRVKLRLIGDLGPRDIVVLPFDEAVATLEPDAFCKRILRAGLDARVVVVGENFHFGARGEGDVARLDACGRECGFETIAVPLVNLSGRTISSSRIRRLLAQGELEEVREILGRPPSAAGRVVHGLKRGRTLGVPTANIEAEADTIFPGRGVYAARVLVDGRWYRAAVNIGHNPTFLRSAAETGVVHVEAFLLGFSGDIYDHDIRVDFLHKIRAEERFPDAEALMARMQQDVQVTAALRDAEFDSVGLGV